MRATILLVNPNTSAPALDMMMRAMRALLPPGIALRGRSAERGPAMITDEEALARAADEVVRIAIEEAPEVQAVIIGAFGNPGLDTLRRRLAIPVVGIGEAGILAAAANGRRFGIATTTPDLAESIRGSVRKLGVDAQFTGLRIPDRDPLALLADPARQDAALAEAVGHCIEDDGAEAVVIGGGPLSDTATRLAGRFGREIVNPAASAVRLAVQRMNAKPPAQRATVT